MAGSGKTSRHPIAFISATPSGAGDSRALAFGEPSYSVHVIFWCGDFAPLGG